MRRCFLRLVYGWKDKLWAQTISCRLPSRVCVSSIFHPFVSFSGCLCSCWFFACFVFLVFSFLLSSRFLMWSNVHSRCAQIFVQRCARDATEPVTLSMAGYQWTWSFLFLINVFSNLFRENNNKLNETTKHGAFVYLFRFFVGFERHAMLVSWCDVSLTTLLPLPFRLGREQSKND